jgi:hypothetical protein
MVTTVELYYLVYRTLPNQLSDLCWNWSTRSNIYDLGWPTTSRIEVECMWCTCACDINITFFVVFLLVLPWGNKYQHVKRTAMERVFKPVASGVCTRCNENLWIGIRRNAHSKNAEDMQEPRVAKAGSPQGNRAGLDPLRLTGWGVVAREIWQFMIWEQTW